MEKNVLSLFCSIQFVLCISLVFLLLLLVIYHLFIFGGRSIVRQPGIGGLAKKIITK